MTRSTAVMMAGVVGAFAIAMAVAACGGGESSAVLSPTPSRTATAVYADAPAPAKPTRASAERYAKSPLIDPLWSFGLDLLARQAAKTGDNVVVSPVSLSAVLSMTLNGARGETAAQMRTALRLESLQPRLADQSWADLITSSNATQRAQVRISDSLWLRDGVAYMPSFLAANRDYFAADARNLPSDLGKAPSEINTWVAQRTGGRIKDLVATVPPETALVLVNTVYAKVGWDLFDKARTKPEPFTLADGTDVQVSTMHGQTTAEVAMTAEYDAVPVQTSGELTFWVVVPKGSQTPESVAALLRDRGAGALTKDPTYAAVDIALPRFHIEYESQELNADLSAMGMPDAFSRDTADFSGMADLHPLYIDSVLQKAMIDVNEKGVEAAAGSAVIMGGSAFPAKRLTVRADRPFLVVLAGSYTAAPLFMALVRDPR
jgi:serine protease inhibitor